MSYGIHVVCARGRMVACLILVLCLSLPAPARAQFVTVGDPLDDYARYLQLKGVLPPSSVSVRPFSVQRIFPAQTAASHPWQEHLDAYERASRHGMIDAALFDPILDTYWNSTRPAGQNDGAVWQGRGLTTVLSAGAYVKAGPLSASLRPMVMFTQNRQFERWPETGFGYAHRTNIDLPQRFGAEAYERLDWGQSYIRLDYGGLAAGLSHENLWWGPSLQNAIVMSNNAPGIPHVFLGTSRPVDIFIGKLQGRWIWGRLTESDYFDEDETNDERFVTAIVLDYSPRFAPGLSMGVTRAFHKYMPEELTQDDYLLVFQHILKVHTTQQINGISDGMDQLISAYMRWLFPESGFELYGELGKGDHSGDSRDLIVELEHAAGYTLGFQKAFRWLGNKDFRLAGEVTKLQAPRAAILRRTPNTTYFYTHGSVRQGYTQQGQVLGAGIGPGSNSQFLGLDWFSDWGRAGLFLRRSTHDVDLFNRSAETEEELQTEFAAGISSLVFYRGFELGASLSLGRTLNEHYVFKNDTSNLNATLSIRRGLMGYR